MMAEDSTMLEGVMFAGTTLGPFFLEDPRTGRAGQAFSAIARLDARSAATGWPFVGRRQAEESLRLMVSGLADSVSSDGSFSADEALTWEYRRLFVGPAPKAAPPWGSVYTDKDQVMFGASTLELRAWMREHGVGRADAEQNPEDHIGLMLVLMAWLAQEKPADLDEYLSLHLLPWSGHFLDLMAEVAEHPFYEGLARLTRATLDGLQAELGLQVEYPRFYR